MIVPPEVQRKFDLVYPYIKEVERKVKDIILGYCEDSGFAYLGRTKLAESLAEKIETGRYAKWSDLDDLFACSIIIPTLTDENDVIDFLRKAFEEVDCRLRGTTRKDPSVFRFDATRFIGRLKPVPGLAAEQTGLGGIRFEVQIRSAFEHAWAVTTHALAYKGAGVDWRHKRLAAQLRAAVEQLDQVVASFQRSAEYIPEQSWPEVEEQAAIAQFFLSQMEKGRLPTEVIPQSLGRFSENLRRLIVSSKSGRLHDTRPLVNEAIAKIGLEMEHTDARTFPRSLSLFQFCLGALCRQVFLTARVKSFVPLITPELIGIYPEVKILGDGFSLDI